MQKDSKNNRKIEKTCQKIGENNPKLSEIPAGSVKIGPGKKSLFWGPKNPEIWGAREIPENPEFSKPPKNLHHSRVWVLLPFFIFLRKGVHHPKSGFFGVFLGYTEISGIFIDFSDHFSAFILGFN